MLGKIQDIQNLIEIPLEKAGVELVELQYRKENAGQMLRVFIDNEAGVDLDLCTRATRAIKPILDDSDIYYDHLELSSPGLDRIIKKDRDFKRFSGSMVKVKMRKQFDGPGKITGVLVGADDRQITVKVEEEVLELPRDSVSTVRLHPQY